MRVPCPVADGRPGTFAGRKALTMKKSLFFYAAALAAAGGLMTVSRQWGGFLLLATFIFWFLHSVFASTDGTGRQL